MNNNYGRNYAFRRNENQQQNNIEQCSFLPNSSLDTITQLEFSREGDPILVASSWDFTLRTWKFDDWSFQNPQYCGEFKEPSNNAILRFCFNEDCSRIFYGTTAGQIKEYILNFKQGAGKTITAGKANAFNAGKTVGFGGGSNAFGGGYNKANAFGGGGSSFGGGGSSFGGGVGSFTGSTFGANAGQGNKGIGIGGGYLKTGQNTQMKYQFGKGAKGGVAAANSGPRKIDLLVPNLANTSTTADNKPIPIPPNEYIVSGLKWNTTYKIVVALTTNGTSQRPYPHSWVGFVDPYVEGICNIREIPNAKIINIDIGDDKVWLIAISSQDGSPFVVHFDLGDLTNRMISSNPFKPFPTNIKSMPTSIAAYPSGQTGYMVSTIQGFVEINVELNSEEMNGIYDGIFRNETSPTSLEVYSSNCVAICPFDKKIAMACSRTEVALFNLEKLETIPAQDYYRIFIPSAGAKNTLNNPITACAFSPSGEVYALAYGYDWSKGAEEMKRAAKPVILIGRTPEQPITEIK